jgi:hypothetical protein
LGGGVNVAILLFDGDGAIVPLVVAHIYGGLPPEAMNVSDAVRALQVRTQEPFPPQLRLRGLVPGTVFVKVNNILPVAPLVPLTSIV